MGLRKIAALLAACLFLAGCAPQAAPAAASAAEPSAPAPAGRAASAEPPGSKSEPGPEPGGTYRLDPPRFLERKDWKLCPLAEDYLTLDGEAFAAKYPDDALWEQGASGRLLFDGRSTAPVIAGISVGDSFTRVRERLARRVRLFARRRDRRAGEGRRLLRHLRGLPNAGVLRRV